MTARSGGKAMMILFRTTRKIGAASHGTRKAAILRRTPTRAFTVSIKQSPTYSPEWEKPEGVPISAMLFGARRQKAGPAGLSIVQLATWHISGCYTGL